MRLWGGVFSKGTDDTVRRLNDSLRFDWRLYDVDITGSRAWASALAQAGVLTIEERDQLLGGLERVRAEFAAGTFVTAPGDEDIHTAVERRLHEIAGQVAGKLHTGRSRNDQVATDLLLWLLGAAQQISAQLVALSVALIQQAERHTTTLMPGMTHFQPAQPITAAHWWLSHFWPLARDVERLEHAAGTWRARCPLGSGALAGTPYPIDRQALAESLGFSGVTANSLDAVADRDHAAEFLFIAALIGVHLSRLAEDLIIFANPSFGFARLDERFSTGSSLMPQKRNPDPLELARGKSGRLIGHLAGLLATLKALPSGYNKDLQEDKEPLFDAFDTLSALLPALTGLIETASLAPSKMRGALDPALLATDLADYLVEKGVPFREAHTVAGHTVRLAETRGVALPDLSAEDLAALSEQLAGDIAQVFDFAAAVARRSVVGGAGEQTGQLARARAWIRAKGVPASE
ncbi:MAG: argininosuccinate lyase [Anaerolineae bacterium]|nr:argininosuccinate lyase [Anaerolineae bacterium]